MKSILKIISFFIIVFSNFCIKAETMDRINDNRNAGIEYRVIKDNTHVIHILEIDPKYYRLELVKAHNSVFGREKVPEMAARKGAIAAINAGFFEIGNGEDGRPSGNLVINGKILALVQKYQSSLILDKDKIDIARIRGKANIKYGDKEIKVDEVNQFARKGEVVLYNSLWGSTTLTPYKDRLEFVLNEDNMVVQALGHGDSKIPSSGWVLSLPSSHKLASIGIGDKLIVDISFEQQSTNLERTITNTIMGIPMLVKRGNVAFDMISFQNKNFIRANARTAIGVREDGVVIMVVTEHLYSLSPRVISFQKVQNILGSQSYLGRTVGVVDIVQILTLTEDQIEAPVGLTLPRLAKLMLDLGCIKALNLDGGWSTTMFFDRRIMNSTIGYSDDRMKKEKAREVSDAIVVIKR